MSENSHQKYVDFQWFIYVSTFNLAFVTCLRMKYNSVQPAEKVLK